MSRCTSWPDPAHPPGYHARQHITKAVAARSSAVHTLLAEYNRRALALDKQELSMAMVGTPRHLGLQTG
mgnify:CR=1 FL=1